MMKSKPNIFMHWELTLTLRRETANFPRSKLCCSGWFLFLNASIKCSENGKLKFSADIQQLLPAVVPSPGLQDAARSLTAAGQMRQSIKRFASSLVQRKGLVKNISLVYLHKYNWPSADREEVKDKAWTERKGQGLKWEEAYWSFLHTCIPSKGNGPLCSGKYFQSKVREENGRTTSKPAQHWFGGAEAHRQQSIYFTFTQTEAISPVSHWPWGGIP